MVAAKGGVQPERREKEKDAEWKNRKVRGEKMLLSKSEARHLKVISKYKQNKMWQLRNLELAWIFNVGLLNQPVEIYEMQKALPAAVPGSQGRT